MNCDGVQEAQCYKVHDVLKLSSKHKVTRLDVLLLRSTKKDDNRVSVDVENSRMLCDGAHPRLLARTRFLPAPCACDQTSIMIPDWILYVLSAVPAHRSDIRGPSRRGSPVSHRFKRAPSTLDALVPFTTAASAVQHRYSLARTAQLHQLSIG